MSPFFFFFYLLVWKTSGDHQTCFIFERICKILVGTWCVFFYVRAQVFYFWKNLWGRWYFIFERIWKDLGCLCVFSKIWKKSRRRLGFFLFLKEFERLLATVGVSFLKEFGKISRTSGGFFFEEFKSLGDHWCFIFERICKNLEGTWCVFGFWKTLKNLGGHWCFIF